MDGRILGGQPLRWQVERQARDRRRAASDTAWPCVWSDAHVIDYMTFAESLPHVEGSWSTPTITFEPWQIFQDSLLYGWRRRDDLGRRRFTDWYEELGRKGAKSVRAAIRLLYAFLKEMENGPQIKTAATTGAQSRIIFDVIKKMVARSPQLREEYGLKVYSNAITCDANSGSLQPMNAKSSTQDGLSPSAYCIDELHAHKDRGLFDVLKSARGARLNPLSLYVTTAGFNLLGVCYEQRALLLKVLQGIFEADHFGGCIYTLDEHDEWTDERNWIKANPMIGVTPRWDEMRQYCQDAIHSPESQGEFKTKRLNLWLSSSSAWLPMDAWDRCADPTLTIESFHGEPCYIGLDLAERDDLTAAVAVFEKDGSIYAFPKFFLPRDVVEERSRAVPAYRTWTTQGVLVPTDGTMTDLTVVEAHVRALVAAHQVQSIAIEQYGGQYLASMLQRDGLPVVLQQKNAKSYTAPSRELETRVKHGRFKHDGNSCFRWQASNCVVERRVDGSLLPKKESANSPNKIDGIDGLLLALGEMLAQPAPMTSIYDVDPKDFNPASAWL